MMVRSFRLSDHESVTELLNEVLSESCYEETMEIFTRQLSWDSGLVLLAVEEQQIVGVIVGMIENNQGYYYRVAVDAAHRRKGIGTLLISSMRRIFIQRNVSKIIVTADAYNEPVLPLYRSLGYHAQDFMSSIKHLGIANG